jgi:hypothetical protein
MCVWVGCSDCQDMDKDDAVCPEIVELTVELLNGDTLKWLLVTVQQTNTKLQVRHNLGRCGLVQLKTRKSWLTIYFSQRTKEALRKYIMWVSFSEHNLVVTLLVYSHRSDSGTLHHVLGVKNSTFSYTHHRWHHNGKASVVVELSTCFLRDYVHPSSIANFAYLGFL